MLGNEASAQQKVPPLNGTAAASSKVPQIPIGRVSPLLDQPTSGEPGVQLAGGDSDGDGEDPETRKDSLETNLHQLFLFGSPLLFHKLMQLLLLFNCFYVAAYAVYFIRAAWVTLNQESNEALLTIVFCPVPAVIVMCGLSPLVIRNYSILSAIAELNKDRLHEVLKNTAHYRKSHALDNLQACVDELDMDEHEVMRVIDRLRIRGMSLRQLGINTPQLQKRQLAVRHVEQ
jgi:hypothetical protein